MAHTPVELTESAKRKLPAAKADRAKRKKTKKSGSIRSAKSRKARQETRLEEIMGGIKKSNRSGR